VRKCSACASANVRRSGLRSGERGLHPLKSPYRCTDCGERFWVIGRPARLIGLWLVVLLALVTITVVMYVWASRPFDYPIHAMAGRLSAATERADEAKRQLPMAADILGQPPPIISTRSPHPLRRLL